MNETADGVAVLGAGLAGLGFALEMPGARVFEAKPHPGGHSYSHEVGGVHFDEGAHISHTQDQEFLDLIRRTAGEVHDGKARSVQNYWRGHWTGYPVQNHLRDLPLEPRVRALTDLVTAATDSADPQPPPDYRQWCLRQYGEYLTNEFYEVFTEKYWRCRAMDLSVDWLGGRLIPTDLPNIIRGAFEGEVTDQSKFATFHYPRKGGFFRFFDSLYGEIDLRLNERATEIDLVSRTITFESGEMQGFDQLASSIPLPTLVSIIKDVPTSINDAAARLRHTKLLCVNIIVDRPDLTESPWCYIYDHEFEPARLSFPSRLAPGSVPNGATAIQAEVFRRPDEPWGGVDNLAARAVDQLAQLLDFDAQDVTTVATVESSHAYVVSDHDRAAAVDHILGWLDSQDIASMGLYGAWKYLWSDAAFRSGQSAAKRMKAGHGIR